MRSKGISVRVDILKLVMKVHGMNMSKFAKAVGIDLGLMSKVMSGKKTSVGAKFIAGLLAFTGMRFEDLFFITGFSCPSKGRGIDGSSTEGGNGDRGRTHGSSGEDARTENASIDVRLQEVTQHPDRDQQDGKKADKAR